MDFLRGNSQPRSGQYAALDSGDNTASNLMSRDEQVRGKARGSEKGFASHLLSCVRVCPSLFVQRSKPRHPEPEPHASPM
jgi:hypothetical protein